MIRIRYCVLLGICFLLCVSGCGYTTRAYIGPYQTIYVAPFKNNVDIAKTKVEYANYAGYYPLLESTITNAVVDRFIFDGSLKTVRENEADVIIKGALVSYVRGAARYAENNEDVNEYRVTITVEVEFYNNDTQKLIWQKHISGDSSYFTTGTQALTEKQALDSAITDLSRRIVEAVVEAW